MGNLMEGVQIDLTGRIDSNNASKVEAEVMGQLEGKGPVPVKMNAADLEYISSAGLRVLLSAQKTMNKQGSMVVKNVSDEVNEIFDVTGFADILTIE